MDLQPNKTDAIAKPITTTRISASEWNQLVGSCMEFITEAGFTPDPTDNAQFLNAFKAIAADLSLVGANTNLSNLTATGEAHFDNTYAKVDLTNLSAGLSNTICTTQATTVSTASNAVPAVVVENYVNDTSWYRVWSDGWCEQGGRTLFSTTATETVMLLKEMKDANYNCQVTLFADTSGSTSGVQGQYQTCWDLTTTSFKHQRYNSQIIQQMWKVSGYLKEE